MKDVGGLDGGIKDVWGLEGGTKDVGGLDGVFFTWDAGLQSPLAALLRIFLPSSALL